MKKVIPGFVAASLPFAAGAASIRDAGRFSPLTQIMPDNVARLRVARTYPANLPISRKEIYLSRGRRTVSIR